MRPFFRRSDGMMRFLRMRIRCEKIFQHLQSILLALFGMELSCNDVFERKSRYKISAILRQPHHRILILWSNIVAMNKIEICFVFDIFPKRMRTLESNCVPPHVWDTEHWICE